MNPIVALEVHASTTGNPVEFLVEMTEAGLTPFAFVSRTGQSLNVALDVDDAARDADPHLVEVKPIAGENLSGADENLFVIEHVASVSGWLRVDKARL